MFASLVMLVMAAPAMATGTTRASMTWDQPVDIDLYIHDTDGNMAWYGEMAAVPDAELTHDNVDGFDQDPATDLDPLTEDFIDHRATSDRAFAYRACYFGAYVEVPPVTTVTLQVWDPGVATPRTVTGTLSNVNDCIDLTRSPDAPFATSIATVEASTANVNVDPFTGEISAWMPTGDRSDLTVQRVVSCPDSNAVLSNVMFVVEDAGGTNQHATIAATPVPGAAAGTYRATIPTSSLPSGSSEIRATFECDAVPTKLPIGEIALIDPSGNVTDATTGQAIAGATVTLHRMPPAWMPRANAADTGANRCDSPESRVGATPWSQAVPAGGFVSDPLDSVRISPAANPQLTNAAGRYAWDVEGGHCWYVTVAKTGYVTKTSALVGVSAQPVLDLHVQLTPVPAPVVTGGGGGSTPTTQDPAPTVDPTPVKPKQTTVATRVSMTMTRQGRTRAGRMTAIVRGIVTPKGCANGVRVLIEQKVGRKWQTRKLLTTTKTGGFMGSVAFSGRGQVRATYVGAIRGTSKCTASSSRPRTLPR